MFIHFYTCITWSGFAFTLLYNFLHFYTYWFVYGCGSSSRIPFQQQHQQSTHFSFYHVKVFQSQFRDKVKHSTLSQAAQSRIPGRFDKKLQTSAAQWAAIWTCLFLNIHTWKWFFLLIPNTCHLGEFWSRWKKKAPKSYSPFDRQAKDQHGFWISTMRPSFVCGRQKSFTKSQFNSSKTKRETLASQGGSMSSQFKKTCLKKWRPKLPPLTKAAQWVANSNNVFVLFVKKSIVNWFCSLLQVWINFCGKPWSCSTQNFVCLCLARFFVDASMNYIDFKTWCHV